jgi:hypothetical protein
MKNIWIVVGYISILAALTLLCSVVFAGDLTIKNVPNVQSVQDEILRNAESSVKNYLASSIKTIEPIKEEAYEAAIMEFRTVNKLIDVKLIGTETVIDGGSI